MAIIHLESDKVSLPTDLLRYNHNNNKNNARAASKKHTTIDTCGTSETKWNVHGNESLFCKNVFH